MEPRVCLKEISVGGYSFTPPLTATGGGVKIFAFLLGGYWGGTANFEPLVGGYTATVNILAKKFRGILRKCIGRLFTKHENMWKCCYF